MGRLAYADPPYIGQSRRLYGGVEVNHRLLLAHLAEFDGWALSASSPSLEEILALSREVIGPNVVRVAAWVKPFAAFKPNVNPAYAWEPVIFRPARKKRSREEMTVRDWVSAPITMQKGLPGAKPEAFCWWLFDLLGAQEGDEFVDIFPGTGVVTRVWQQAQAQRRLFAVVGG